MENIYCIYKFTNMINGKSYIGKSKRIKRRYQEHVKGTVWRTTGKKSLISKAIGKYGIENFSFEIIKECGSPEEMNNDELKFILEYNTVVPNGYNLRHDYDEKYVVHENTKKKLSIIGQGIRHAKKDILKSQYIGVNPTPYGTFVTHVRINHKIKSKTFATEIESAEAYDKMVMFLYGENARINFEERRNEYIKDDLEDFYKKFITNSIKKTSKYKFVTMTSKKRWIVKIYIPKNHKEKVPSLSLGSFSSEDEAAETVDKMNWFFGLGYDFNFPEKVSTYDKESLKLYFYSKETKSNSKYVGVSKTKTGKWRSYFYLNRKQIHVGSDFDTEEEAYSARRDAIKNGLN
jgi:group I intron endonuclease